MNQKIISIYAVIVTIVILLQLCTRKDRITVVDKTVHTAVLPRPIPNDTITNYIVRWKTATDTIIQTDSIILLDSTKCLELAKIYYSRMIYNRTLVDDSLLTFKLFDTVSQNSLQTSRYEYKINRPMQIVSNEKRLIFGTMSDTKGISLLGGYNSRNWIYYGGYDVIQKRVNFGLFKKF